MDMSVGYEVVGVSVVYVVGEYDSVGEYVVGNGDAGVDLGSRAVVERGGVVGGSVAVGNREAAKAAAKEPLKLVGVMDDGPDVAEGSRVCADRPPEPENRFPPASSRR